MHITRTDSRIRPVKPYTLNRVSTDSLPIVLHWHMFSRSLVHMRCAIFHAEQCVVVEFAIFAPPG